MPRSRSSDHLGTFPVVGIGASAGGLAAFEDFFAGLQAEGPTRMAFVVVQHLDPDHKSLLSELIRRVTPMTVVEVQDGMQVEPDQVYVIPPGSRMTIKGNNLHLEEPAEGNDRRFPIDAFFSSLARSRGGLAVGIILSGSGTDGTQGARDLKDLGGLVLVQSPETAEFDSMPRSVRSAGLADFTASPQELAVHLVESTDTLPKLESLKILFAHLKAQTGHDFALYKPSTILRRIDRRRVVHGIVTLDEYVLFLLRTPEESRALFQDLLIGVTHFFRDPEAFEVLATKVIPKLLETKAPDSVLRVWSTGCSTGEESYSLAILFQELLKGRKDRLTVQIFATDLDGRAIETARAGWYPRAIEEHVSAERLSRHFSLDPDGLGYRVRKSLRTMMVFSEHDLIKDPPFSKVDLLVCRNVLIYLGAELQKRLVPLFHYSLNPGGMLFLGPSETVGENGDLFSTVDRKAKVFRREDHPKSVRMVPKDHFAPTRIPPGAGNVLSGKPSAFAKQTLRDVAERTLLLQVTKVAALVNAQGDIMYFHGRTGRYLEPAPGIAGVSNLLKMARDGLRYELASMLRRVTETGEAEQRRGLPVRSGVNDLRVDLGVCVAATNLNSFEDPPLYLVTFEEVESEAADLSVLPADSRVSELQKELRAKEEFLQNANEELENSNDELRWSNEQAQSVNEELQSTNEELETSKEELQSVNEELSTVNTELQVKVADLSRVNNDMNNLLAGNGIATVFVDLDLRILRFTPAATRVINLIPSDLGRPVGHIISNIRNYNRLTDDVREVLETLVPKETEVQCLEGVWFNLRIQPYRTLDNIIEGAVVSFIDINKEVRMRESLDVAEALARNAIPFRDSSDAVIAYGLDGRIVAWNPSATKVYGWTESEALSMTIRERIPGPRNNETVASLLQISRADVFSVHHAERKARDGTVIDVSFVSVALIDDEGVPYAVATIERPRG